MAARVITIRMGRAEERLDLIEFAAVIIPREDGTEELDALSTDPPA
jgi:hypothetical protein